jgi:hypothetical protein
MLMERERENDDDDELFAMNSNVRHAKKLNKKSQTKEFIAIPDK